MAHFTLAARLVALGFVAIAAASSVRVPHLPRGKANSIPAFPFDIGTAKYCVWWFDSDSTRTCQEVETLFGVSIQDLVYWNPSLTTQSCKTEPNQSYCVSAIDEQHLGPPGVSSNPEHSPEPVTVTVVSTSVLEAPAPPAVTITVVSNSVKTIKPTPFTVTVISTEAGAVAIPVTITLISTATAALATPVTVTIATPNPAVTITSVATSVSISIRTLIVTCTLPAATLAPITITAISTRITTLPGQVTTLPGQITTLPGQITSLPGQITSIPVPTTITKTVTLTRTSTLLTISTTTATTTRTVQVVSTLLLPPSTCVPPPPTKTSNNGINTPNPIQEGMTTNCKTFYYVQPGETCAYVAAKFGISVDKFISWNPSAKRDCTSLWALTYACVAVL